jgi:hypothetical protein
LAIFSSLKSAAGGCRWTTILLQWVCHILPPHQWSYTMRHHSSTDGASLKNIIQAMSPPSRKSGFTHNSLSSKGKKWVLLHIWQNWSTIFIHYRTCTVDCTPGLHYERPRVLSYKNRKGIVVCRVILGKK